MTDFVQTTKTIIIKEKPLVKEKPLKFTKSQLESIQDAADGVLQKESNRPRSIKTIEYHLALSRKKTKAKNTVHLIAICMRLGFIK